MAAATEPSDSGTLKVLGIAIRRVTSATVARRGMPIRIELAIEVQNVGDKPVHVWVSRRHYDYDATTQVLTLRLAEIYEQPPPHVTVLSDHARSPVQIEIGANSRVKLLQRIPATVRHIGPGSTPETALVDDPIGPIRQVNLILQYSAQPIRSRSGTSPVDFREQMRTSSNVLRAQITPTSEQEK
jgi:hypothetical protein